MRFPPAFILVVNTGIIFLQIQDRQHNSHTEMIVDSKAHQTLHFLDVSLSSSYLAQCCNCRAAIVELEFIRTLIKLNHAYYFLVDPKFMPNTILPEAKSLSSDSGHLEFSIVIPMSCSSCRQEIGVQFIAPHFSIAQILQPSTVLIRVDRAPVVSSKYGHLSLFQEHDDFSVKQLFENKDFFLHNYSNFNSVKNYSFDMATVLNPDPVPSSNPQTNTFEQSNQKQRNVPGKYHISRAQADGKKALDRIIGSILILNKTEVTFRQRMLSLERGLQKSNRAAKRLLPIIREHE